MTGLSVKTRDVEFITSERISPILRQNLLKARQLRNILKFDGFTLLEIPVEFAIQDVTNLVFLDNSLIILDTNSRQVLRFEADGSFIMPVSRNGQGPEEYDNPLDLKRIHNNQVVVTDKSGIVIFDSSGNFSRRIYFKDIGVGFGNIEWSEPEHLFITNAFSSPKKRPHAMVTFSGDAETALTSFGLQQKMNKQRNFPFSLIVPVGDKYWVASKFLGNIDRYDLDGKHHPLKADQKPLGVTPEDFGKAAKKNGRLHPMFKHKPPLDERIFNSRLVRLGPIVIRTYFSASKGYGHDVFDSEGQILARDLHPGATSLDIVDTYEKRLFAKVPALQGTGALTEQYLKSKLYRSEYDALQRTGYHSIDDDDHFFIWTGHLADY